MYAQICQTVSLKSNFHLHSKMLTETTRTFEFEIATFIWTNTGLGRLVSSHVQFEIVFIDVFATTLKSREKNFEWI